MLLQLVLENFLSFRDRVVLSMLADARVGHKPGQEIETNGRRVLRAVALYGANGSGKSNLVKAFRVIKRMILNGTANDEQSLPIVPFKLDEESRIAPSHIEVEFVAGEAHYSYGFKADTSHILAEWLYRIDPDGEVLLFDRPGPQGTTIVLGDALTQDAERRAFLGYVATGTRENQLFLAEAGQKKVPELAAVREHFRNWAVVTPRSSYGPLFARLEKDERFREAMVELLRDAGTAIQGLRIAKRFVETPGLADLLDTATKAQDEAARGTILVDENEERLEVRELWTLHRGLDGSPSELNIYEESDGTRRLLDLAPLLYDLDNGDKHVICIIDEIDRSLHSLLTRLYLDRFLSKATDRAAQLIFTTHDTNILDFNLLSRDSVGFIETKPDGGSIIYPLSELNQAQVDEVERHGRLEAGYLDGRFGAVPFFGLRKGAPR